MKYCPKCGTENGVEANFCKSCGTNFEGEDNTNTTNTVNEQPKNEGLGTASLVLGIISLVLGVFCIFFFPIFISIPLAIVGLILGIVNKANKGKKFAGIILNAVAIFVSIIMAVLFVFIIGFAVNEEAKRRGKTTDELIDEIFNNVDNYNNYDYLN